MKQYNLGVVGATSNVGEEIVTILEQRDFPVQTLRLFATEPTAGARLSYKGKHLLIEKLDEQVFRESEIVFFAAGVDVSQQFAALAVKAGAIVIDTTSVFRLHPDVPLIIPEVNPHIVPSHHGIIASPGSITIQLGVVLRPLHTKFRLKRVVVSTYQAVSENGKAGVEELDRQIRSIFNSRSVVCQTYPHQIAFNCLPHIDDFLDEGMTAAEQGIIKETQKILETDTLGMSVTAVRVPVFYGNAASVNIETERPITPEEVGFILEESPGIKIVDDPSTNAYPVPIAAVGEDEIHVGRIRADESVENGVNLWMVTDNLRKGAALNAVQIAEVLIWNAETL